MPIPNFWTPQKGRPRVCAMGERPPLLIKNPVGGCHGCFALRRGSPPGWVAGRPLARATPRSPHLPQETPNRPGPSLASRCLRARWRGVSRLNRPPNEGVCPLHLWSRLPPGPGGGSHLQSSASACRRMRPCYGRVTKSPAHPGGLLLRRGDGDGVATADAAGRVQPATEAQLGMGGRNPWGSGPPNRRASLAQVPAKFVKGG